MRNEYFGKMTIIGLATLIVMFLMLMIVPAILAQESEPPDYVGIINLGSGADQTCYFFNGIGGSESIAGEFVKIVVTPSENNNILLQCEEEVAPSNDGTAIEWDAYNNPISNNDPNNEPLECKVNGFDERWGEYFGVTLLWRINISASGNAILTCHFERS